jgi:uncharacterized protein
MTCSCGCGGQSVCIRPRRHRVHDRMGHESCHMVMHDRSTIFHCDAIGKSQSITPEGFLICHDVPIARTGEYLYGPGETPVEPGPDGVVHIWRSPDEVFHPHAIGSFEGKDVVDEHPDDSVTPDNWRKLAVGHAQNVHRGEGINDDYLFADLVIKAADAIKAIQEGKKEVSAGYDAEYRGTGSGRGEQYNIRGNHIALVDRGRCGPRCAIKDHQGELPMPKSQTMKDRLMALFGAKDDAEFQQHLAKPLNTTDDEGEGKAHVVIHNHMPEREEPTLPMNPHDQTPPPGNQAAGDPSINSRLDRLEQAMARLIEMLSPDNGGGGNGMDEYDQAPGERPDQHVEQDPDEGLEDIRKRQGQPANMDRRRGRDAHGRDAEGEAPDETEEEKKKREETEREMAQDAGDAATPALVAKAKDSAFFMDGFQETAALAAIIAPGIELPTFDKAADPRKTFDSLTKLRCKALDAAYSKDPELKSFIDDQLGGKTFDCATMSAGVTRSLFRSVGALQKRRNAASFSKDFGFVKPSGGGLGRTGQKVKTPADLNKLHAERYGSKPFS